jgi:hypothetical protein
MQEIEEIQFDKSNTSLTEKKVSSHRLYSESHFHPLSLA